MNLLRFIMMLNSEDKNACILAQTAVMKHLFPTSIK